MWANRKDSVAMLANYLRSDIPTTGFARVTPLAPHR